MQLTPTFKIFTQPTDEPVTIEENELHSRISGSGQEAKLQSFLIAARKKIELASGLQLMPAVYRGYLDAFPYLSDSSRDYRAYDATYAYRPIMLPIGPLISFDSLQYVDTAGVTQIWASTNYRTDIVRTPARITPEFGLAWPVNRMVTNAVILQFTAGYANASTVPELAKQAIHMVAADWFRNREMDYSGKEIGEGIISTYRAFIHELHWMEFDE